MEQIYILKLRGGKYYIGKTKNIEKRWDEHITGRGSGWTKKHIPISLIATIKSTSHFDEDKYVKEYMAKYGIENVRGGTYSNVVLDTNSIAILETEIRHSKNQCTRCGRDSHYIKDCYASTDIDGAMIKDCKKETVVRKTTKKNWSDYNDDSNESNESNESEDSDCEGSESSDCDDMDEVIMSMTSGMLKNARKNRAII